MKPGTLLTTVVLAVVAVAHIARLVLGVQVTIAGVVVPMWVSIVGTIASAGLALALWHEHRNAAV